MVFPYVPTKSKDSISIWIRIHSKNLFWSGDFEKKRDFKVCETQCWNARIYLPPSNWQKYGSVWHLFLPILPKKNLFSKGFTSPQFFQPLCYLYSHGQDLFYKFVSDFTNKLVKQLLSMTVNLKTLNKVIDNLSFH